MLCCPFRQAVPGGSGFEIFEAPFLFQLTLLKVGYARWHEHDARSKSVPAGCRQEGCRQEDSAKAVLKQKADCNDRITRHEPKMLWKLAEDRNQQAPAEARPPLPQRRAALSP